MLFRCWSRSFVVIRKTPCGRPCRGRCVSRVWPVIRHLQEMMSDPDPHIRRLAVRVLTNFSVTSGVSLPPSLDKTLIAAMDDPEEEIRERAPRILGRIGTASDLVIPALIKTMTDDKYTDLRGSSISALGYMGRQLEEEDPDLQRVIRALSDAVVAEPNDSVRARAASYLGGLEQKAQASVPALLKASNDHREQVREYARQALHKLGTTLEFALRADGVDEDTIELIKALATMDGAAHMKAQEELTALGPKNLDALMLAVRLDNDGRCWNVVAWILGEWDQKVLPELDRFIDDEHDLVRRTVARAWGRMSLNSLPDKLPKLLDDNHNWVRWETIAALGRLSRRPGPELKSAAVPLLIESLAEEAMHRETWREAVGALREVGAAHPDVIPALIEQMKTAKNEDYRVMVADELGDLGYQLRHGHEDLHRVVNALAKALEEESLPDVRRKIIGALRRIGPKAKDALPTLRKARDDPWEDVSTAAYDAVGEITGTKTKPATVADPFGGGAPAEPPAAADPSGDAAPTVPPDDPFSDAHSQRPPTGHCRNPN